VAAAVTLLPIIGSFASVFGHSYDWRTAPRHSIGIAPDPATETEAIVQVYTARAFGPASTSTVFGPFGGFQPFAFYPGYSADFFDGKHYVLKGGSPQTAAPLLRSSFRNWFRADYPYIHAAFRLVKPA